jgi:hypothetical protein
MSAEWSKMPRAAVGGERRRRASLCDVGHIVLQRTLLFRRRLEHLGHIQCFRNRIRAFTLLG